VIRPAIGSLHHVELWVPDLARAATQWDWLLGELGYAAFQDWPNGRSWRLGATYLVIEQSPALSSRSHDRLRPGMNHLAFHAGTRHRVNTLTEMLLRTAGRNGWPGSLRQCPSGAPRLSADKEWLKGGKVSGEARDITGFLYEIGLLKRYERTGWSLAGVPVAESVADHSFRASVVASAIATMEGADPQRAAFLSLWHDSQETRTTDLPHLSKRYVTAATNEQVTSDQVRPLPPALAGMIHGAVMEYEAGETPEARCARDADKLECLLQAREYQDQGHSNVQPWIGSSIASLRTASAKQLADEALAQSSLDWLQRAREDPQPDGA
jgi:putative hydrolase of HD superfamily